MGHASRILTMIMNTVPQEASKHRPQSNIT